MVWDLEDVVRIQSTGRRITHYITKTLLLREATDVYAVTHMASNVDGTNSSIIERQYEVYMAGESIPTMLRG